MHLSDSHVHAEIECSSDLESQTINQLVSKRCSGHFSKFQLETLFYIFYNMPRDTLQAYAATELYNRDWRYHKDLKLWFTRAGKQGTQDNQKGQYIYFDINEWKKKMFHGAGSATPNAGGNDATDGDGNAHADVDNPMMS